MSPDNPLSWKEAKTLVDLAIVNLRTEIRQETSSLKTELRQEIEDVRRQHFTRYAELQRSLELISEKLESLMISSAALAAASRNTERRNEVIGPLILGAINIVTIITIEILRHK